MSQYPTEDRGATSLGYTPVDQVEVVDATETAWPPAHAYDTTDSGPSGTADVAKDEAAQVKDTAVDAGKQVAGTAKAEAQNVVGEAKEQAVGLLDQAKGEAGNQVSTQQQRVAGLLGGYASELQAMTSGQESSGPITDLARQGADKASEITSWLENHEPADVLDEIRAFARRRPVAFLVGAALAGAVAGRATRGFAANAKAEKLPSSPATPVRAELPGTYSAPSRSLVEEVPTQADAFGPGDGTATSYGTSYDTGYDAAVTPAFDDPRRDDVVR